MAWTQTDIDALKAAIATGALKVKFGAGPDEREITYRSLADMNATLAQMQAELSPASAPPLRTVGAYGNGTSDIIVPPPHHFYRW